MLPPSSCATHDIISNYQLPQPRPFRAWGAFPCGHLRVDLGYPATAVELTYPGMIIEGEKPLGLNLGKNLGKVFVVLVCELGTTRPILRGPEIWGIDEKECLGAVPVLDAAPEV